MDPLGTFGDRQILPPLEQIIESDKTHDYLFEEYLNSRGWKSKHKCVVNQNSADTIGEIDTSANISGDTSGSFHGDNPRYNLFPDSSDRLVDSFDGEVDRLSDMSFNPREVNSITPFGYEDENNEDGTDNDSYLEITEDVMDHELKTSRNKVLHFDETLMLNIQFPMRKLEFYYEEARDAQRNFTKKVSAFTKVSYINSDNGIPLNSKDTLINYNRVPKNEVNYLNFDRIIESKDPMFGMANQPMQKFPQSTVLGVTALDQTKLEIPDLGRNGLSGYFRSNLSATYSKNGYNILVVATGSRVNFFNINNALGIKNSESQNTYELLGWINLRFQNTTVDQIRNAVNPYEPYSINYLTIKQHGGPYQTPLGNGELPVIDALAVCNDYSQVVILDMGDILSKFNQKYVSPLTERAIFEEYNQDKDSMIFECYCKNNDMHLFKSNFKRFDSPLSTTSSAWCVDIKGTVIAVSDNHRRITVFSEPEGIYRSPVLSHNIPFLTITGEGEFGYSICCGTYGSHIYILHFDPRADVRVSVKDVISTDFPIWTCNIVKHYNFLNVNSLKELTGDLVSDLEGLMDKVITQSKILEADSDSKYSSHVGFAANFTHLSVPSITSRHYQKRVKDKYMASTLVNQFERMRKLYDEWYTKFRRAYTSDEFGNNRPPVFNTPFLDEFILATSAQSIGLFSFKELINLSTCKNVFPVIETPYIVERNDNSSIETIRNNDFISFRTNTNRDDHIMPPGFQFLNRIYLSFPLLELNAIAVATQAGQVAIFRLTHFQGIHSMRLEWVLIDAERYAMGANGHNRSIIGLTGYKSGFDRNGDSEWVLIVVYTDLVTLSYRISKNPNDPIKIDVLNIL